MALSFIQTGLTRLESKKGWQFKSKFIYSEKATNFSKIYKFVLCSNGHIYGGDFAKFCGILRIYELYYNHVVCNIYLIVSTVEEKC